MITRADLTPQYQIPQAMHAALEFAYQKPELFREWHDANNSVIILAAKDEADLKVWRDRLHATGFSTCEFREPDIDNEITSIAVIPDKDPKKILSSLPLAGKIKNG